MIRSADKLDEANYLCKSSNGIGKGLSWSTSLKVTGKFGGGFRFSGARKKSATRNLIHLRLIKNIPSPDPVPAHFDSSSRPIQQQQQQVVRKLSQVQLRCDAYGDQPITIEWFKNKQPLSQLDLDSRYSIHSNNNPLKNGLISQLLIKQAQRQDNSIYECVTRNPYGKDRLPMELVVQEEPDNIQELQASQINSRSATLMWSEPYDGRAPITSYMFQYKKIQEVLVAPSSAHGLELDFFESLATVAEPMQSSPTAITSSSIAGAKLAPDDDWQQASRLVLPMAANSSSTGSLKSITIEKLEPSSKYILRALAMNSIGQSKFSQPMEFTTDEEAPDCGPVNIRAVAINSTSIQVSWDEIPKGKQLGRIHGYYIGYRVANNNTAAANFVYKPYIINDLVVASAAGQAQAAHVGSPDASGQQQAPASSVNRLDTVLHDLRRDTVYEITVVAFNSRGSGPSSDFVVCKTIEMEAPKPVKLSIRRESNESIFIEWQRDPTDQNPVDDYVLYQEKNSASQEWLQVRLPGNQTQYKAPGLKCGTRYQFYIISHNKVGRSQPSEVVSASTSGALPVIPTKTGLIKMVNSTCLLINLNAFQDNGCRIKTFTVRYRAERSSSQPSPNGSTTLVSSNGLAASHQPLSAAKAVVGASGAQTAPSSSAPEWITIRPRGNLKRANEEDRMEYMCELSPVGEYSIHVAAANDVGRSEIEYSVLMSSDELRHSLMKDLMELVSGLPNVFAYIPSIIVFLLAGLLLSLVSLVLYTTAMKYYQKFVIMQNQIRATRRAKADEKRRRKLANSSRHSQKLDLWADEYEEDEEEEEEEENREGDGSNENDEDGDDEDERSGSSNCAGRGRPLHSHLRCQSSQFGAASGHYLSNIANSAFDTSSIDSPCNQKFRAGSTCMSTASTESIHGRFQCLNSKQYVKMNEYTMLPSISASLSPANDIYGTTGGSSSHSPASSSQLQRPQLANGAGPTSSPASSGSNNNSPSAGQANSSNSLYYSTLRRTNMQTYLPRQQQQQQINRRQSQNMADIYGYYMAPQGQAQAAMAAAAAAQQAANEAANSIFVPAQQIIYSAPNIRRQPPVFL